MGWYDYYRLIEKYHGDLDKATKMELDQCAKWNPNNPVAARRLAEERYKAISKETYD